MASRSDIFRAHVEADSTNPLFRFSLGQALLTEGDYGGALEHLRIAAKSKSDWMMPRILLGKCYLASGLCLEAKAVLVEALALAVSQGHEEPEEELRALLATF
jgi:uncharacterized protein HemY